MKNDIEALKARLREAMPQYLRGLLSSDDIEGDLNEAATTLDQQSARIQELEGALREIEKARPELLSCHSYSRGWNDALFRVRKIARAALNGGEGK